MNAVRTVRSLALTAIAAVAVVSQSAASEDDGEYGFDRWYAGAAGTMVLPQGGGAMRRLGGATARIGYYLTESLSVEADAAWLEDCVGLGVQGLWHIYGYERLDPFLTFGARGWVDGNVGPTAGIGTFYHLTDSWSLRFDAQSTLGLDGGCAMAYTVGAGVQYSF